MKKMRDRDKKYAIKRNYKTLRLKIIEVTRYYSKP